MHALLILMSYGNAALAASNAYLSSATQTGGITFGTQSEVDLVARGPNEALRATYFHKWLVHRRIRPEEFGGRIHNQVTGAAKYPIHQDILNSSALQAVFNAHGTYRCRRRIPSDARLTCPIPWRTRRSWVPALQS